MKTVKLIAKNNQGASVEFYGKNKTDALRNFKAVYSLKGWEIEYIDQYGNNI